jgi:hypothetical protein
MREDGWEAGELAMFGKRVERRFPRSARDVVFEWFELDAPSVLVAGGKCPRGQVPVAYPGSDFDLLAIDDDNPMLALLDYEDDVMGETQCVEYHRGLAYGLHDHLLEMGEAALFVRNDKTRVITLYREQVDEEARRIWMRLSEEYD